MISLEDIEEKQEELNKMIEEYKKQDKKEDNLISTWDKKWKPKKGESYYFITSLGDIYHSYWGCDNSDNYRINCLRVFKTKKISEKWLKIDNYLRSLSFEPDWEDRDQTKYSLSYDVGKNEFYFEYCFYLNSFAPFYFEDREILTKILKKYSTEELKFYFNI